ncbi:DsbC family protein [Methylomicrobium lacus]|uniref:DsbC family protein n=1 Tax=Methylomicrobium lacus TaxID=136992 RepID=UPI0035A9A28D
MKKIISVVAFAVSALSVGTLRADENDVKKALTKADPSIKIDSIKPSEIKGLLEVEVGANIIYVSEDGKYLLQGHLVDLASRTDLTEEKMVAVMKKMSGVRKAAIEKLGEDNMIIFKPKIARYTVSVFTDIDCGYCRKLHSEIDQYLAQGITVRYMFFPRAGKGSDSYKKAISVWCADDRNTALTNAKKGLPLKEKTCKNPVDQHMQLVEEFGLNGTPAIITAKGDLLPGYVPAKQLVEELKKEEAGK